MQTITRRGTDVSLYLIDDGVEVDMGIQNTVVGNPPEYVISDCSVLNAHLYEGVSSPEDWIGGKYLYTPEAGWTLNPNYHGS